MTTIHVYHPTGANDDHTEVLQAMKDGTPGAQWRPLEEYTTKDAPDIAVIFGMYKRAVPYSAFRGRVLECQRYLNKRVLVLERGYIHRDSYYAAGWEGLNGRANFMNCGMPNDRARMLGVDMTPPNLQGEHVLIAGQVPWDSSVEHTNFFKWVADSVIRVHRITDAPIIFRPHPLAHGDFTELYDEMVSHGVTIDMETPAADLVRNAKAVVTYNSNFGVDSVLAGKPTLCFDRGSMVWAVARHHYEYILDPAQMVAWKGREQWLNDIAYAQWTLEEMRDGMAWGHLMRDTSKQEDTLRVGAAG